MRNPPVRSRYTGILLLLLCPLMALMVLYHPNDYAVSKRSHRIIKASDRWVPQPLAGNIPYQWVDNDNITIQSRRYGPMLINTITDQRTPFFYQPNKPVSKYFKNTYIDNWVMSPNSNWLLSPMSNAGFNWVLMRRDLSQAMVIPATPSPLNFPVIWSQDSKHWYRFTYIDNKITLLRYSVNLKHPLDIIPIKSSGEQQNRYLSMFEPIGEIDGNRLICIRWDQTVNNRIESIIYDITSESQKSAEAGNIAIPHIKSIPVPKGASMSEVELSPDGNRLAWVFNFRQNGSPLVNIGEIHPATMGAELWVSDIDGENMHPVCVENSPDDGPKAVRWKPDNKHVTFIFRQYLYQADAQ